MTHTNTVLPNVYEHNLLHPSDIDIVQQNIARHVHAGKQPLRHALDSVTQREKVLRCGKSFAEGITEEGKFSAEAVAAHLAPEDIEPTPGGGRYKLARDGHGVQIVTQVSPCHWLDGRRFDIMAKVIFAHSLLQGSRSLWGSRVYVAHLMTFNNCTETEGGRPVKQGCPAFIESFTSLVQSVCAQGFTQESLVPILVDQNSILNGAHRVAAAHACGKNLNTVQLHGTTSTRQDYPAAVFGSLGLPTKYMDAMAIQLVKSRSDVFVCVLFPIAERHWAAMQRAMKRQGKVLYVRDIVLSGNGPAILIYQLYINDPWIGDQSNAYAGVRGAARQRFPPGVSSHVKVLILQMDSLESMQQAKAEARQVSGLGNPAIHATDTPTEATHLAESVLNKNGVQFLNTARHFPPNLALSLSPVLQSLAQNNIAVEDMAVDGSGVLQAYG